MEGMEPIFAGCGITLLLMWLLYQAGLVNQAAKADKEAIKLLEEQPEKPKRPSREPKVTTGLFQLAPEHQHLADKAVFGTPMVLNTEVATYSQPAVEKI